MLGVAMQLYLEGSFKRRNQMMERNDNIVVAIGWGCCTTVVCSEPVAPG